MTALEREFDPWPVVRAGFLILAAGILGLGGWSLLAPLTGAVIAPGFVKIDLNRKVVQHQEGGIVSAIRVRDGDRVKAGQELILLDDVRVDAQLDLLRTQYDTERAKAARLEAERAFAEKLVFPRDIADLRRLWCAKAASSARGAKPWMPRLRCCASRSARRPARRRRSPLSSPPRSGR